MSYKVIAGWKVDKIADLLTKGYDQKIKDVKNAMREQIEKELIKHLPQEVLVFWSKYPERLRMQGSVSLKLEGEWFYTYPNVPVLDMDVEKEILTEMSPIRKDLVLWKHEIDGLEAEKKKIKNQIRCTARKLNTYKRLQTNFPEAYEVLILKIDEEPKFPQESLCDNVEQLRAKLNSSKNEENKI